MSQSAMRKPPSPARARLISEDLTITALLSQHAGAGVRVAVLDTGADIALLPNVRSLECYRVRDGAVERVRKAEMNDSNPDYLHGTRVALEILALAREIDLVCVNMADDQDSLSNLQRNALTALEWAVFESGAHIVNTSWTLDAAALEPAIADACQTAYLKDIAIVASEDNFRTRRSLPALLSTVNGVRSDEAVIHPEHVLHYWPNLIEFGASGAARIAPVRGSSFAAAKISGIAALILSAYPGLHPYELKSAIVHLARCASTTRNARMVPKSSDRECGSTAKPLRKRRT